MEERLAWFLDRAEIIDTCTRMHWYLDRKEWDRLEEVLAPEISVPTLAEFRSVRPGQAATGRARPRGEFVAGLAVLMEGLTTQHLVGNHLVDIDGDRASCYANASNMHVGPPQIAENRVVHGSAYEYRLARTPDGWRITALNSTPIWATGNEMVSSNGPRQDAYFAGLAQPAPTDGRPSSPGGGPPRP